MTVWLVRAGKHGERQDFALENGYAVIGWGELPDLSLYGSPEELKAALEESYPQESSKTISHWQGQLWAFKTKIMNDDIVALPLKGQNTIALGKIIGGYEYLTNSPNEVKHVRRVKWLVPDMPRERFDQDLLYSLGAFSTVCSITRNNAEERIKALIEGKPSPIILPDKPKEMQSEAETAEYTLPNLEESSLDQIQKFIGRKFKGHKLAGLIEAILQAQGYKTEMAPPGPDGGVDIIAGQGPLGFESPRILVQVKSSDGPEDIKTIRELQGIIKKYGADHGLFVSWGGFKRSVHKEKDQLFFNIRLWDAGDIVNTLFHYYETLPEDIRADLPLKRIWVLVQEEQ